MQNLALCLPQPAIPCALQYGAHLVDCVFASVARLVCVFDQKLQFKFNCQHQSKRWWDSAADFFRRSRKRLRYHRFQEQWRSLRHSVHRLRFGKLFIAKAVSAVRYWLFFKVDFREIEEDIIFKAALLTVILQKRVCKPHVYQPTCGSSFWIEGTFPSVYFLQA